MGIGPADFWRLTPYTLGRFAHGWGQQQERETDRMLAGAWHAALWSRVDAKHFPELATVLARGKKPEMTPEAEAAGMRALFMAAAPARPKPKGPKEGADGKGSVPGAD